MRNKLYKIALTAIFGIVMTLAGCAVPKLTPQESSYSETVEVPGMGKEELFTKINLWSSDAFKGPDSTPFKVIELSRVQSADPEQGIVTANYTNVILSEVTSLGYYSVFYVLVYSKVAITVDEGRYQIKFDFTGIQHTVGESIEMKKYKDYKERIDKGDWIYSKLYEPSYMRVGLYQDVNSLNLTRNAWNELANALRSTVSGIVVGN